MIAKPDQETGSKMPDGCNLYLTREDLRQIETSLKSTTSPEVHKTVHEAYRQCDRAALAKKVTYPLSNPAHPAHKVFADYVVRNVAGNESINDSYRRALPRAVARIARQTPDVVGLVRPAGETATAADRMLAHRTRGDAFAYELMGSAHLLDNPSTATDGYTALRIYPTDRIDLGERFQATYPGAEDQLLTPTTRATIEADLAIKRPGQAPIAVDFKHSRNAGCYSAPLSSTQLRGIVTAITTGSIAQFHFVTNGYFEGRIVEDVEKANHLLRSEGHGESIYLHNKVQYHSPG